MVTTPRQFLHPLSGGPFTGPLFWSRAMFQSTTLRAHRRVAPIRRLCMFQPRLSPKTGNWVVPVLGEPDARLREEGVHGALGRAAVAGVAVERDAGQVARGLAVAQERERVERVVPVVLETHDPRVEARAVEGGSEVASDELGHLRPAEEGGRIGVVLLVRIALPGVERLVLGGD